MLDLSDLEKFNMAAINLLESLGKKPIFQGIVSSNCDRDLLFCGKT